MNRSSLRAIHRSASSCLATASRPFRIGTLHEPVERCFNERELDAVFSQNLPESAYRLHESVPAAYQAALADTPADQRILVFGSFHTLEAVMRHVH